jgi:uncharacterized protein with von Willebrand factor type A (vWA) domain
MCAMDERARQKALRKRLSATSRKFLESIDELRDLEERKRNELISTPAFHELAEKIKEKSREVFRVTAVQESLGDELETTATTLNEVEAEDGPSGSPRRGEPARPPDEAIRP